MKKSTMCILSGFAGSMLAVACGAVAVDKDSGVAHAEEANLSTLSKTIIEVECDGSEEELISIGTSISPDASVTVWLKETDSHWSKVSPIIRSDGNIEWDECGGGHQLKIIVIN